MRRGRVVQQAAIVQPRHRDVSVDHAAAQRNANGVDFTCGKPSAQCGAAKLSEYERNSAFFACGGGWRGDTKASH